MVIKPLFQLIVYSREVRERVLSVGPQRLSRKIPRPNGQAVVINIILCDILVAVLFGPDLAGVHTGSYTNDCLYGSLLEPCIINRD